MKLNNSIKLAIANFAMFWKILLYKVIALGISILFVLPVWGSLKSTFSASGLNSLIKEMFNAPAFQSVSKFVGQMLEILNSFFKGISSLATNNIILLIYLAIILLIVIPFLFKLSDVPASESAYSYMSSLNRNSFTINFITSLDKSMGYSILRAVLEIPFWFIIGGGVYGILSMGLLSDFTAIISPLLLFIFVVTLLALNSALFSGLAPSVVVFNCCASKALPKGFNAVKRNFFSILSSFSVVMAIIVALFYIFGVYSLIFIIPFMSLILSVFGQVLFFESQGMDYYISPDKIITPRKLECADSIKKVKNII